MTMSLQPRLSDGLRYAYIDGEKICVGARMGRRDWTPDIDGLDGGDHVWNEVRFRLYKMQMSPCGAYDKGGAYWGAGNANIGWMYRAYTDVYEIYVRARSRRTAKEKIQKQYPKIRFFK